MYPFPMTMGLGAAQPFPMHDTAQMMQMGALGQTPQAQAPKDEINWMHVGGGALAGLAAGWFLFKK